MGARSVQVVVAFVATTALSGAAPARAIPRVIAPMVSSALGELPSEAPRAEHGVAIAASPVPAAARLGGAYGLRTGRTGRRTFHAGVDFRAVRGTPVFAVRAGSITAVAADDDRHTAFGGYGNAVVIHHKDVDQWTFYAHLDRVLVEPDQPVSAGQLIGYVGNSSNRRFRGMGVHLHFEVRERPSAGGSPFPGAYRRHNLDPRDWLRDQGIDYGRGGHLVHEGVSVALDAAAQTSPRLVRFVTPEPELAADGRLASLTPEAL